MIHIGQEIFGHKTDLETFFHHRIVERKDRRRFKAVIRGMFIYIINGLAHQFFSHLSHDIAAVGNKVAVKGQRQIYPCFWVLLRKCDEIIARKKVFGSTVAVDSRLFQCYFKYFFVRKHKLT
ncbi:MAG: hypothetical protein IIW34_06910 [Clostridia bacterium]|nr:hypothetical protein [Clostridia bacterium]